MSMPNIFETLLPNPQNWHKPFSMLALITERASSHLFEQASQSEGAARDDLIVKAYALRTYSDEFVRIMKFPFDKDMRDAIAKVIAGLGPAQIETLLRSVLEANEDAVAGGVIQ